jgi:hypothetical protein
MRYERLAPGGAQIFRRAVHLETWNLVILMTFVMGDCPSLHSLENNQEGTVTLILTREAVLCGPRRTPNSSGRNRNRGECQPADYEGSAPNPLRQGQCSAPVSMRKVLAVVCFVGFHGQPDCMAGVPVGAGTKPD